MNIYSHEYSNILLKCEPRFSQVPRRYPVIHSSVIVYFYWRLSRATFDLPSADESGDTTAGSVLVSESH